MIDDLDFIPEKKKKSNKLLWLLAILSIAAIGFSIWAQLNCPGMEKLFPAPSMKLPSLPPLSSNGKEETQEIAQGNMVISGVLVEHKLENDVLYIKLHSKDKTYSVKFQGVTRVINQETSTSVLLNARSVENWMTAHQNRGIAITVGIRNGAVEDMIILTPLN